MAGGGAGGAVWMCEGLVPFYNFLVLYKSFTVVRIIKIKINEDQCVILYIINLYKPGLL